MTTEELRESLLAAPKNGFSRYLDLISPVQDFVIEGK